jgi:hypothetical protein
VVFNFNRYGYFDKGSGAVITHIEIKPAPLMNHGEATSLFMNSVENDGYPDEVENQLDEGCIVCELGYYDLNAGKSLSSQNFILARRVRFEKSEYPFAVLNDSEKTLIYYADGIID